MGILNKKFEDDNELPGSGVRVDLETKACPDCRREALPWQTRCEDCDVPVIRQDELPATGVDLPGLAALLDDEPTDDDRLDEDVQDDAPDEDSQDEA